MNNTKRYIECGVTILFLAAVVEGPQAASNDSGSEVDVVQKVVRQAENTIADRIAERSTRTRAIVLAPIIPSSHYQNEVIR